MDSLPPVLLGASLFIPFMAALALRRPMERFFIFASSGPRQIYRQFLLDYSICILVGSSVTIYNMIIYGFPLISGFKIIFGCIVTGLFASLDMALSRERAIIHGGQDLGHCDRH